MIDQVSLKKISFEDLINAMTSDEQFVSLVKAYEFCVKKAQKITPVEFTNFIVANSIICYQLSWTGEKYWEEFSFWLKNIEKTKFQSNWIKLIKDFVKNSKNNKRLLEIKMLRLDKYPYEKMKSLISNIFEEIKSGKFSEWNFEPIINQLTESFSQKHSDKTMVFALKMFSYAIYIVTSDTESHYYVENFNPFSGFPEKTTLPVDSRIKALLKENWKPHTDSWAKEYLKELAKWLEYPLLAYDAVLWPKK